MRREVELRYNPQLGTWYDPRTWFSDESKALPAPGQDPTKISSDFISPEWERVAELEQENEKYRKNMMILAGVFTAILVVTVFFKRRK